MESFLTPSGTKTKRTTIPIIWILLRHSRSLISGASSDNSNVSSVVSENSSVSSGSSSESSQDKQPGTSSDSSKVQDANIRTE